MIQRKLVRYGWPPTLAASACLVLTLAVFGHAETSPTDSQESATQEQSQPAARQPLQVADRSDPVRNHLATFREGNPNEHPLLPAIRWARQEFDNIEKIEDYSAVLVKRERVGGEIQEEQYMFIKMRHQPLSVYMYFLKPKELEGRETIYIDGPDGPTMYGHGTGIQKLLGTLELDPTGLIAMKGQRYPITEIGILNLVRRLIIVGEDDMQYGECEVKFFPGATLNDRKCTCIQVVHPVPRRNFLYYVARIFVDEEMNVPVRYEAYDWPAEEGATPELIEQYTYMNLKLNNGFTDADFDIKNPNYQFSSK